MNSISSESDEIEFPLRFGRVLSMLLGASFTRSVPFEYKAQQISSQTQPCPLETTPTQRSMAKIVASPAGARHLRWGPVVSRSVFSKIYKCLVAVTELLHAERFMHHVTQVPLARDIVILIIPLPLTPWL